MTDYHKIDVSETFNDNEIEFSKAISQAQIIIDRISSVKLQKLNYFKI